MASKVFTIFFNIDIAPKAHDMGRNLLRGAGLTSLDSITEGGITLYRINSMSASLVKIVDGVDGNKGVWAKTNAGETNVYRGVFFIAAVNKGEQYTLSAWVKGTAGNTLCMEFVNSNGTDRKNSDGTSGTYQSVVFNLTDGWQRVSHTFTVDSKDAGYVECNFFTNVVGEFTVSEPKLERGDTATAFCLNEDDLKGDKGTDAISYSIELDPNFNSSATLTNSGATVTVLVAGKFNLYSLTGAKKSLYSGTAHYALSCAGAISEGEVTGGIGTPNYSKDFDSKNQSAIPSSAVLTVYKDSTKTSVLAVQIIPISINAGAIAEFDQKLGQYSIMVASQRTGQNMWVNGDFSLPDTLAPAFSHIIGPNASTSHVERIDGVDLPDGFLHRLVFNVPVANGGICYKGTQPHINTSTIAETGTNGLVTKNDYVLSLYAKATASCDMAIGLENVLTKTVNLTGQWKRFYVHIPKGTDLEPWTTAVIFYPTTAIGTDKYVCITGIQFETGATPQTWSKSDFDMEVAGLRIGNGGIEAIAGKFDYIGKDGKPYIRVEQDKDGYPHFVFYIPGTEYPAYDLGSTGLSQIVESSHKLEFPLVPLSSITSDGKERKASGYFYVGKIDWSTTNVINAWDLCYEYYQTRDLAMYKFLPAYFVNKAGTKIYVPTSAQALENKMYWTQYTSDGLPLGDAVEDGWYLLVTASQAMNSGRVREYLPNGLAVVNLGAKTQNYVDYLALGIKGGKILSQSIAFRVETWPTQGSLLVGQVQSGNLSLRLSFLDDTEDSDQIAYDTSAGTLTFKSPVVKQG